MISYWVCIAQGRHADPQSIGNLGGDYVVKRYPDFTEAHQYLGFKNPNCYIVQVVDTPEGPSFQIVATPARRGAQ